MDLADALPAAEQPPRTQPQTTPRRRARGVSRDRSVARGCGLEAHELGVVGSEDHVFVPSSALGDIYRQESGTVGRYQLVASTVGGRAAIGRFGHAKWAVVGVREDVGGAMDACDQDDGF